MRANRLQKYRIGIDALIDDSIVAGNVNTATTQKFARERVIIQNRMEFILTHYQKPLNSLSLHTSRQTFEILDENLALKNDHDPR